MSKAELDPEIHKEKLVAYFNRIVPLNVEQSQLLKDCLLVRPVRKRQFVVQPGFVCQYRNYVSQGALRSYFICMEMKEHTTNLAVDDWWITDPVSYMTQQPATLIVEALADSILVQLDRRQEMALCDADPVFERIFRLITERMFMHLQRRIVENLSNTAEVRYNNLLQRYPAFIQAFPQYIIASYLGVTTEFISKIRNKR